MKKYSFWSPFWMSFYSADFYRDVAYRWRGAGLLFLFVLVLLTSIPEEVVFSQWTGKFAKEELPGFAAQFPPILTIKDGVLTTPENRPYRINLYGKPFLVIDASGEPQPKEDGIYLGKKQVVLRTGGQDKTYELSAVGNLSLTPANIDAYGKSAALALAVGFYPLSVLFLTVARIMQAFLFSIVAVVMSNMKSKNLDYLPLLRVTVMAMTPPILITLVASILARVPYLALIYCILVIAYLFFAVGTLGNPPAEENEPPLANPPDQG